MIIIFICRERGVRPTMQPQRGYYLCSPNAPALPSMIAMSFAQIFIFQSQYVLNLLPSLYPLSSHQPHVHRSPPSPLLLVSCTSLTSISSPPYIMYITPPSHHLSVRASMSLACIELACRRSSFPIPRTSSIAHTHGIARKLWTAKLTATIPRVASWNGLFKSHIIHSKQTY